MKNTKTLKNAILNTLSTAMNRGSAKDKKFDIEITCEKVSCGAYVIALEIEADQKAVITIDEYKIVSKLGNKEIIKIMEADIKDEMDFKKNMGR